MSANALTVIECDWCEHRELVETGTAGPILPLNWRRDIDVTPGDEWSRLLCPSCAAGGPSDEKEMKRRKEGEPT